LKIGQHLAKLRGKSRVATFSGHGVQLGQNYSQHSYEVILLLPISGMICTLIHRNISHHTVTVFSPYLVRLSTTDISPVCYAKWICSDS